MIKGLQLIIDFINDHMVYGTQIHQSLLNQYIEQLDYKISDLYILYLEIRDLHLPIKEDEPSSLSITFRKKVFGEDNLLDIINGLPKNFTLSDVYLFDRDLLESRLRDEDNIKTKTQKFLSELVTNKLVIRSREGVYRRTSNQICDFYFQQNIKKQRGNRLTTLEQLNNLAGKRTQKRRRSIRHPRIKENNTIEKDKYEERRQKKSQSYLDFLDNQTYFENYYVQQQSIRSRHNDGGKWN